MRSRRRRRISHWAKARSFASLRMTGVWKSQYGRRQVQVRTRPALRRLSRMDDAPAFNGHRTVVGSEEVWDFPVVGNVHQNQVGELAGLKRSDLVRTSQGVS